MKKNFFIAVQILLISLSACQPVIESTQTNAIDIAKTEIPTNTPKVTPTTIRNPPDLPEGFKTTLLNPLDTPRSYVKETCKYLKDKWTTGNATPGTVVMIIAFQSITKYHLEANDSIETKVFDKLMVNLHKQGFETITTEELYGFLYHNYKIPERSVMLIQDRQRRARNYHDNFGVYNRQWGWTVVNAWTSQPETSDAIWQEQIELENAGFVDHQAYGITTDITLNDSSPDERFEKEFNGSIKAFEEHFGKKPIAFIWPGGSFGIKPVQAAREYGYELGFTLNQRGPVMYNWIPLADKEDEYRPSFPPEGSVNDPLMVLPRYWAQTAIKYIDQARVIGEQAMAYEQSNKETELEYYDIVCAPTFGTLFSSNP